MYNITDLSWQWQWAGPNLQNLRLLVCPDCLDIPQEQLKPRILPPDPMPTLNARPENFLIDDYDYRVTEIGGIRVTEDGAPRVVENIANNRTEPITPIDPPLPPLPPGEFYLTDSSGFYLTTDDGSFLIGGP